MTSATRESSPAAVHGTCASAFEPLRELLARNLGDGTDLGASVAVVRDGELVVDLWGGEAEPGKPWEEDTIVQAWSVTKTMAALTALVLVDRGVLDLDAPVASYWKGFRDERVLVRHLLSHTSGHAGWTERVDIPTLLDLEHSERLLAEQEPWFEPGSESGYSMVCYGHLVDGLVRGATGSPLADVFREEVAGPLGADFHLGLPESEHGRVADLVPPPRASSLSEPLPERSLFLQAVTNPLLDVRRHCNSSAFRQVSVAGINGHGNARSIARIQSVMSHGGARDAVRLLSPETVDRALEVQASGQDRVLPVELDWGLGYALSPANPAVPSGRICWWTGYGGSVVVNDLDRRVTFAYAMNRMENHLVTSPRTEEYVRTAFACLEGQ